MGDREGGYGGANSRSTKLSELSHRTSNAVVSANQVCKHSPCMYMISMRTCYNESVRAVCYEIRFDEALRDLKFAC